MKPYRSTPRVVLLRLPAVIALILSSLCPLYARKHPQPPLAATAPRLGSDPLTQSGFDHFYNMEYDKAIRDFEQEMQARPDDPSAANHLLTAVLFKELYRIGALDTELFANDSFLDSRHFPVDSKVRARIRELTDRALLLSEQKLRANPEDVSALYARGVTRGMRSTTMGLLDKAWFAALRNALGARRDHERVLEMDPNYADAKMVVGVHNYIIGSLSWAVKAAASIVGISGNRQKGIQYLYEAANGGGEASVDAKIALSLFLRREQRYPEAITLVAGLMTAYPRNYLVALEHANLLNAAGHGPDAVAAYRKLLVDGKDGRYQDPRLEQAAYGLGEALGGQRDFQGAAEAYESVGGFPHVDPELQGRSNLAAGQMYDMLQKRDLAVKKYQQVLTMENDTARANAARKYLKQAYTGPRKG